MKIRSDVGVTTPASHHAFGFGSAAAIAAETPEFHLAAACCRWPPSQARNAAIRAAAAGVIDWTLFSRLVKRQRVGGLVHDALLSAALGPPSTVADDLAAQARQIARRNLLAAAETGRLQRLFDAANIRVVVLKGAALAQLAYGSLSAKHARDIDLLVPPDRAEAAIRLLERQGYALTSPAQQLSDAQCCALIRYGREIELIRRDNRLFVELQWRVADNPLLLKGVDAHSSTQDVMLPDGVSVRTLTRPDLFAYLCVHGARHAWSRLKWLADVDALITANDGDIAPLYRHARERGAGFCAAQALLLCRQIFDLELPPAVAAEITGNKRVKTLVAIALAAMTAPYTETEVDGGLLGVSRSVLRQFLLGKGRAFFMAQCRASAVGVDDVIRLPLPPSLHFFYPLLRLPLWLWRRAIAAPAVGRDRAQRSELAP
jgi:hypothetical protein